MKLFSLRMFFRAMLLSTALVLGVQSSAHALSIRIIQQGGSTTTCADGAACDTNTSAGVLTMNDPFAGTLSATVQGTGSPILGSQTLPDIDLSGVLTTPGSGTFRFLVSDTGFTGPLTNGLQGFEFHIGGTRAVGASVSSILYLDSTNTVFGTQKQVSSVFFPPPVNSSLQSFSNDTSGSANSGTPYSLTIETIIAHSSNDVTSFDAEAHAVASAVPEPSSLLLLGSGLLGLGWLRRRQNNS